MKRIVKLGFIIILLVLMAFTTQCGTQYIGGDRNEKWEKDLNYLKEALPRKHPNLFFKISEKEFESKIDTLKNSVKDLNDDEICAGICEIVASIGDAHTKANIDYSKRYPVEFYYFNKDIYLINTTNEYKQALNCKLIKVNNLDINKVEKLLEPLIAHENEANIKKTLPSFFSRPDILHGKGIIDDIENVNFTFQNSEGKEFNLNVKPLDVENSKIDFIITDYDKTYPLYMQNSNSNYWYKYIEDKNILYFKYNQCVYDEGSGDIDELIKEMLKYIDNKKVDKFVIDMRNNSGGSDGYLMPLIEGIKKRYINDNNKLFVVVGRQTFSSAVINASQLREETNAKFIGEPTSGKPNHYGQVNKFQLPNHKIQIRYSTKEISVFKDNSDSFTPHKTIEVSINDYVNKKDPVLEYILSL